MVGGDVGTEAVGESDGSEGSAPVSPVGEQPVSSSARAQTASLTMIKTPSSNTGFEAESSVPIRLD